MQIAIVVQAARLPVALSTVPVKLAAMCHFSSSCRRRRSRIRSTLSRNGIEHVTGTVKNSAIGLGVRVSLDRVRRERTWWRDNRVVHYWRDGM